MDVKFPTMNPLTGHEHGEGAPTHAAVLPPRGRQRLDTVVLQRPRCPKCGGAALRRYRSIKDQGDGSSLSWVKCLSRKCGHHFRMVLD